MVSHFDYLKKNHLNSFFWFLKNGTLNIFIFILLELLFVFFILFFLFFCIGKSRSSQSEEAHVATKKNLSLCFKPRIDAALSAPAYFMTVVLVLVFHNATYQRHGLK